MQFLAILETMWDWRQLTSNFGYDDEAPDFFKINPENFTGKRLYYMTGVGRDQLYVTNACPQLVNSASAHGTPDVKRLESNVNWWCRRVVANQNEATILVCGKVAQKTFEEGVIDVHDGIYHVYMPHPAWRGWTNETLDAVKEQLGNVRRDLWLKPNRRDLVVERLYDE